MPIVINKKTDKFFISINKHHEHSFVMLGVYDRNMKVKHVLCRVGKAPEHTNLCLFLKNVFFSFTDANLVDEGLERKQRNPHSVSYHAYDITYGQYLEFIQILESIQDQNNLFKCYKPETLAEDGDEITLIATSSTVFKPKSIDIIKKSVSELHVGNTCRHTAIQLVEATQNAPISSLVSTHFPAELPYKTMFEYGMPTQKIPFYVLPFSPHAYPELDEIKKKVITKLYTRMERMLLLEPNSPLTQSKFLKLKDLYLEIVGAHKELSIDELLKSIQTWRHQNLVQLMTLRKTYFWDSFFTRSSATIKLIADVEQDLKTAKVK